ncbi:MAG: hypothetical protein WBP45_12540 [Daejeonella sp.]
MVTIIKKGTDIKEIDKVLSKLKSPKKFDAYKYLGTVKLKTGPLEIQKKMRDEWSSVFVDICSSEFIIPML